MFSKVKVDYSTKSRELRNAFYNNFKDLIEQAKKIVVMILFLILFIYYLGAVGTLLLNSRNVPLETFVEKGGNENLYKIVCIAAILIWPITIIIGLIILIFRKNEDNT